MISSTTTTTTTTSTTPNACGDESGVCSIPIYPRAVTSSLRKQMKGIQLDDVEKQEESVEKLQLPATMEVRRLNDATMIELEFSSSSDHAVPSSVREIDVLRGREMIKHHSSRYGSIVYVVRRPG
jgi:hypothetical protein